MSFKKLIEPLKETLAQKGIKEPLPLQKKILSKIKGGSSMFVVAPKGAGKTTSIILSVIQNLKGQAVADAPRALIFVENKQAALELESEFYPYVKDTDLRVYCAYDEKNIDDQRDEIYMGTDIVIATPKRLNKIFFLNGINLNELQMCIIDDAHFLLGKSSFGDVVRTPESIGKCQYLIFTEKFDKRFENWQDTFMYNSLLIKQ
ncbi:DEAD/DEAH box helicase [Leeuwenhoekiella sp. LLG6367-2.1]|uniref:DEAD/DEAH box helicase n=1 Tax=Leeuwenhoekiella sp. LLG6367-2.1 TaxID=3160833 RepID=UPI00386E740C|tara:strand:- start:390 stop:1001 length:612 start_codon:yes stop_codon:yes gene_type:complete